MGTPWDQITDESYKSWLLEAMTIDEFNGETPRNRRALLTDFKHQQQDQPLAFVIGVRVLGAERSNGACGSVYKFLERHVGHYSQKEGIRICYNQNGYLNMTAYFLMYNAACQFQNAMNDWEIHEELANLNGVEVDPITPQRVVQPSANPSTRLQAPGVRVIVPDNKSTSLVQIVGSCD